MLIPLHFAGEASITLPHAYDALLAGEIQAYQVVGVTNMTRLTVNGTVYEDPRMNGVLIPPEATFGGTPGPGGGTVTVRSLYALLPNLAEVTVARARPECGLHDRAGTESGALAYEVAFSPLMPSGYATAPEVRLPLASADLPTDTVLEVRRAGVLIATLTPADQYVDAFRQRVAILRGAWSSTFRNGPHTLTLRRTGGGALPSLPVAVLEATGDYDGYPLGVPVNFSGALTAQRDAGAGLAAWPACPLFTFGAFPPRVVSGSGVTAARPATWPPSLAWFDTTLGRPVWRRPDGVWVDATGAAV